MAEPISTVVLELVAKSFISSLVGKSSEQLWAKLEGDPTHNAFKQALGSAIQRYATSGSRLDLAQPLLQKNSPLKEPDVAAELTQLIRFEREPNAELIGKRWKAALDNPPAWRNFAVEANLFLDYLKSELQNTAVFRPIFEAKSLAAIGTNTATSAESLANLEAQLSNLSNLLDARFGELIRAFAEASPGIRDQIYDYTRLIEDKSRSFVGRQFVFDTVNQFIQANSRGYFFIRGDPGIGKSAIAAQMVKTNGYIHHFNIQAEGINKAENFITNICAQLIAAYDLDYSSVPPEASKDGGFLSKLLGKVSDKLEGDKRAILVIDAMDEVDFAGLAFGANSLYLPQTLPPRIYLILTTRRIPATLRIDCEQGTLDIEQDSKNNITDIREYIEQFVNRPGLQTYMATQGIDEPTFVKHLVGKSQGNFIYLRYALPEIESGAYQDIALESIPLGLQNYYQDHWKRIRGQDEEAWFSYKLPVLVALTIVKESVSIDLMSEFSRVKERPRIGAVLREWSQFLHEEHVEYQGGLQKRYRIYHASFQDFITSKDEIVDERINLEEARKLVADALWSGLYGNK
jgi:hypothetical protein